jgi:hypothetical protein
MKSHSKIRKAKAPVFCPFVDKYDIPVRGRQMTSEFFHEVSARLMTGAF